MVQSRELCTGFISELLAAVLAFVCRVHYFKYITKTFFIELVHVVIPISFYIAVAEYPGLLAFEHVVANCAPVTIVDFLFVSVKRHTQKLIDQVVTFVVECNAFQCKLI